VIETICPPCHPLSICSRPSSRKATHRYVGIQRGWFPGVANLQGWEALPTGRGDYWVRVWMSGEEPQSFRDPMSGADLELMCREHVIGGEQTGVDWRWDWESDEPYPSRPATPRVGIRERIGMVYLAQDPQDHRIKIGFSSNPRSRYAGLCSATGKQLRVLRLIPCRGSYETKLHQDFARQRLRGEWFRASPELLRFSRGHHYCSWGTGLKLWRER
jgi:hypothetical protein